MTDLSAVLISPSRTKQEIAVLTSGVFPMPAVEGQSLAGNWTLEITDSVSNSRHVLTSWSLTATPFEAVDAFAAVGDQTILTDQAIDRNVSVPSRGIPPDQLAAILWLESVEKLEQRNTNSGRRAEDPDGVDEVFTMWE